MEKQPLVCDKEVQIVLKALDMFFNRTNKSSRDKVWLLAHVHPSAETDTKSEVYSALAFIFSAIRLPASKAC